MAFPETHVFICTNRRNEGNPTGCCASKGSEDLVSVLKEQVAESGLKGKIRINKAGCLGQCAKGVAAVVYPKSDWYGGLTTTDVEPFFRNVVRDSGKFREKLISSPLEQ